MCIFSPSSNTVYVGGVMWRMSNGVDVENI